MTVPFTMGKQRTLVVFISIILAEITILMILRTSPHQVPDNPVTVIDQELVERPEGTNLQYYYEPKAYVKDPVLSPVWLPYKPEVTINGDTLNERSDYEPVKATGMFRILLLGDSWTYGQFVSTADNFSEKLEEKIKQYGLCRNKTAFEVINLGVAGYDLEYSAERYRLRGVKYQPDLIVWLLGDDDLLEINEYLRPQSRTYVTDDESLRAAVLPVNSNFLSVPLRASLTDAWKKALIDQSELYGGKDGILAYQKNVLDRFSRVYTGNLIFYSLQNGRRLDNVLRAFLKSYIVTHPGTQHYESIITFPLLKDGHPTKDAHMRIADDLYQYLSQHVLRICHSGLPK